MRAEVAMDIGEANPVARIRLRQRLHRGDRAAHCGEVGIVRRHAAHRAAHRDAALRIEGRRRAQHCERRTAGSEERVSVEHPMSPVREEQRYRNDNRHPIRGRGRFALWLVRLVSATG
jgi:hypothetical protein